jgi:hypothetical protein
MNARFPLLKVRTFLAFAYLLAFAGLMAVLYFMSLVFAPELARAWVAAPETLLQLPKALAWISYRVHPGIVFALAGLALMGLGVMLANRQEDPVRLLKQRKADALRRRRDYRESSDSVDGRREPYIS